MQRAAITVAVILTIAGAAFILLVPSWILRAMWFSWLATDVVGAPAVRHLQGRGVLPTPLAQLVFPHVPACQHATCPRLGWWRDPIDGTRACHAHTVEED